MHWYYESDGQPQGPIPDSQLRQLIAEHKVSRYNRVWREGMEDWAPVGSLPEFQPRDPLDPAYAASRAPGGSKPHATAPFPPDSQTGALPDGRGNEQIDVPEVSEEGLPPEQAPPPVYSPAWENSAHARGPLSLVRTAFQILFQPAKAFGNLNHEGHWGPPLAYYLTGCIIGWLSFFETAFLLVAHDPNVPPRMLENFQQLQKVTLLNLLVPSFLLSGMLGPIVLLGAACCLHGALAITGAARQSLATTYRLAAYLLGTLALSICLMPASVRIAVAFKHPEKSGFWASDLLLLLGIWMFTCTLRGAATAHRAKPVSVFLSLLILLFAAIIPPFLLLLRVAEMAALGS